MRNISFIGGDNRNLILSNLFESENNNVFRYGFQEKEESLEKCIQNGDIIVTAIPFSNDTENIYAPIGNKTIKIQDFIYILENKTIIGGKISNEFIEQMKLKNNNVIDIMKNEALAIKNTIPTAEGIIKILIENTDITIDESNIAILGFGKVGKQTSKVLYSLGANIFCYDIKKEEVANIDLCGYNVLKDICSTLGNMDIIINTIPQMILDSKILETINKKTLILDVSSKPGGVDFNYAIKNGFKVIHELGIPGKVAPVTSAKYIKEIIENLII